MRGFLPQIAVHGDARFAYHRGTMSTMKIAPGNVVRIEYEIRIKGGDVIESSAKAGPLTYTHGEGTLLPALEKRLEGLKAGEKLDGEIPAAEVIPPEDTLPVREIPRREFPGKSEVEVGSLFEAHTATGGTINLRIIEVNDDFIKARLLPPLAGKDLEFKVRVMRIEDPVNHLVSVVTKPPPPLPARAVKIELEEIDPDPESEAKLEAKPERKSEAKVPAKSESKVPAAKEDKPS
jgi:FKBP-type peptidyl-prolyl cis-trans isomerase 2